MFIWFYCLSCNSINMLSPPLTIIKSVRQRVPGKVVQKSSFHQEEQKIRTQHKLNCKDEINALYLSENSINQKNSSLNTEKNGRKQNLEPKRKIKHQFAALTALQMVESYVFFENYGSLLQKEKNVVLQQFTYRFNCCWRTSRWT